MTITVDSAPTTSPGLSLPRLYALRGGYLFMGLGLALVKWPLLADASTLPLWEGVTLCLLTGMSLLALLGVRYPVKLLPILLFETVWKVLWLGLVALPKAVSDSVDSGTAAVAVNCSLVVVVIAVVPWGHVWRSYVRASADPWR